MEGSLALPASPCVGKAEGRLQTRLHDTGPGEYLPGFRLIIITSGLPRRARDCIGSLSGWARRVGGPPVSETLDLGNIETCHTAKPS